jgi:predicted RNase H-like HicB family nuclease
LTRLTQPGIISDGKVATELTFPVIIHESKYGFDVSCPTLPGCASQGDTYEEAIENIKVAIKEYLEAVDIVEKSKSADSEVVLVEVA